MKGIQIIGLVLIVLSCSNKKKETKSTMDSNSVSEIVVGKNSLELEVVDFSGLESLLNKKDGKVYVVNFWATWCGPCVKELPFFERIHADYLDKNVEVILVSLDFPHLYDSKLKPFILNKKIVSKVVALDDPDMNSWIPKVNANWSGSIPATVIYKNEVKQFYEKSFTFEELETEVKQFLK
jgi:thiol-disulfide isomerase/thioredoxin